MRELRHRQDALKLKLVVQLDFASRSVHPLSQVTASFRLLVSSAMPPSPHPFIRQQDLQTLLAEAVASFSPLATLVGSDSARSLSQHVSNIKQACAASIAPIGALGMMATVCKGE